MTSAHDNPATDPRVFFAAERTFLAWIRTAIALMGFGFVVARFGIFLQQIALDRGFQPVQPSGISAVLGVLLIVIGVLTCLAASWRHVVLIKALRRGQTPEIKPSTLAIALAVTLALVGLLMTFYLLYSNTFNWSPSLNAATRSAPGFITATRLVVHP